jgi:CubicO group peptidase (beta-lactamase class C family)
LLPINKMSQQDNSKVTTEKTDETAQQMTERRSGSGLTTRRHLAAHAAAYKALYYASGIFTAGRTPENIDADISGTSRAYDSLLPTMKAVVDKNEKIVSVNYLPDMPPRIAAWRPVLGSTQLPIGATADIVKYLPRLPDNVLPPDTDGAPWPQGDHDAIAQLPTHQAEAVATIVERAFDRKTYKGNTWGIIIVKDGKIVCERYDQDRGFDMHASHRTNSAAKSFAVTVIGAAVKKGLLDIYQPAPISEWKTPGDPRARITINDLLHMCSGLYTEAAGNPQQELYFGGAAAAERSARNIIDSMPGKRWVYAGSDTILAMRALRAVIRDDTRFHAFPFKEVFWKIGMTRTSTEMDWNGDFLMSGQAWSTARDFARLALLYLNDGVWNGERILPEGWAKYVATPAPDQPNLPDGSGYGAQFWLFGPKQGLPEGTYTPGGARGQFSMIVPSKNVIVVRRALDYTGPQSAFRIARFTADILTALDSS